MHFAALLHVKPGILIISGFFIILNLFVLVWGFFIWREWREWREERAREARGGVQERRTTREVVEELELTDRITWGRP